MFNNYKEMFQGYVDLYGGATLLEAPREVIHAIKSQQDCPMTSLEDGHNESLSSDDQNQTLGDVVARLFHSHTQLDALDKNHSVDNHNHQHKQLVALNVTTINSDNINSNGVLQPHLQADPRLLLEGDGTKLVRLGSFNSLETIDLVHITTVFIMLVFAKRLLSAQLSQFKQLDKMGLRPKDRERLDESIWRLLYYSFSSTWLIYSCLKHNSHLLLTKNNDSELKQLYHFHIEWATYAIFMIEAAFYLHATYALLFEDVWRRDSPMMLVHHLAAVFTVLSLYATRTHQIGLASTVLRDTCDVLLEVTKLTKCFHIQHGKRVRSLGMAVNCCLSAFALIFAINQLYYFPLFCIFHGLNLIKLYHIRTPVMMAILTCGLIFLLLDLLWFGLILRLLYYMALAKPMKDLREYDDEDEDLIHSDKELEGGEENNSEQTTRCGDDDDATASRNKKLD